MPSHNQLDPLVSESINASFRPPTRPTRITDGSDTSLLEDIAPTESVDLTENQMQSAFPPAEMNVDRSLGENTFSRDNDPTIEMPTSFLPDLSQPDANYYSEMISQETTEPEESGGWSNFWNNITGFLKTDQSEDTDPVKLFDKSPIDYILEAGYLLRSKFDPKYPNSPNPVFSGFNENSDGKAVTGFFKQGLGLDKDYVFNKEEAKTWDPTVAAWCAAFVNHVLMELGADTIDNSDPYFRLRANEYKTYGQPIMNSKLIDAKDEAGTTGFYEQNFVGELQEGDLVLFDFPMRYDKKRKTTVIDYENGERDGKVDHITFYAGDRITEQGGVGYNNKKYINVVGGNQANAVSLKQNDSLYTYENIASVRRITKNDISWELNDKLSETDPIFLQFKPVKGAETVTETNMAQGGLTSMSNQTQMAFALGGDTQGVAETIDPVSGNDVPPGSLPVEVRDDIDAKLSEGEYVVPADVVRFFGVKLFEDLRAEAKMGLQKMEEDGRIGGDPVPMDGSPDPRGMQEDMALNEGDVQKLEQMFATGVADGGLMDKIAYTAANDKTVNDRMNAKGIAVAYAEGGLEIGTNPTEVDNLIDKALQNPKIMKMVADKIGTVKSTTTANMKPDQMQGSNPTDAVKDNPVTTELNEGGYMAAYFNGGAVKSYSMGGFEIGYNPYEYKTTLDNMWSSSGASDISLTLVVGPDGVQIPIWWNSTLPLPDGYVLASEATATASAASATADQNKRDDRDRERNAVVAKPFDYKKATDQELADLMSGNEKMRDFSKKLLLSPAAPIALVGFWGANKADTMAQTELKRRLAISKERNLTNRTASITNVLNGNNSDGTKIDNRGLLSKFFNIPEGGLFNILGRVDKSIAAIENAEDGTGTFDDLEKTEPVLNRPRLRPEMIPNPNYDPFINSSEPEFIVNKEAEPEISLDGSTVDTSGAMSFTQQDEQKFDSDGNPVYDNTSGSKGNFLQNAFWSIFSGTGEDYGTYADRVGLAKDGEYTGTGVGGKVVGKISGQDDSGEIAADNLSGVVADQYGFGLKVRDILPSLFNKDTINSQLAGSTVFRDKGGYAFTKNMIGATTYLRDENGKLVKDFDANDGTTDADAYTSSIMNPKGLSKDMYFEAIRMGMNPKNAPEAEEGFVTVVNPNSNTWGRSSDTSNVETTPVGRTSAETSRIQRSAEAERKRREDKSSENEAKRAAENEKAAKEFTDQFQKDYDEGEGKGDYDFSYGGNEGGLLSKPKKSYKKGGYVTNKKTKQRKSGLASRS